MDGHIYWRNNSMKILPSLVMAGFLAVSAFSGSATGASNGGLIQLTGALPALGPPASAPIATSTGAGGTRATATIVDVGT